MSNISELANVPQISFIENMTMQETEEQLKAEYARIYREQTGKELVLGEADAKTLLLKAFALIEYQTMQYADIKGQAELLKTSTGEALDALVALLGLTRQESKKATAKERFMLAEARADTVAVPAGTRVKTQGGRYFNTLDYAEIPPGATYVDTIVQAEEAGAITPSLHTTVYLPTGISNRAGVVRELKATIISSQLSPFACSLRRNAIRFCPSTGRNSRCFRTISAFPIRKAG